MAVHAIKTNLLDDERSDLLLQTYQRWISFALGMGSIGGRMLKNPSGRYAASITAQTMRVPAHETRDKIGGIIRRRKIPAQDRVIAIFIDGNSEGSVEAGIIEHGHGSVDLKETMLRNHPQGRMIPMRQAPTSPLYSLAGYKGSLLSQLGARTSKRGKRSYLQPNSKLARMWSSEYHPTGGGKGAYHGPYKAGHGAFAFMSPNSKGWIIPPMPAYSPAKLLRDQLPDALKRRISIP